MDLKTAIQKTTDDYDTAEGETADPTMVVRHIRGEINHKEIDFWELEDAALAEAYHTVVDASDAEIAKALA